MNQRCLQQLKHTVQMKLSVLEKQKDDIKDVIDDYTSYVVGDVKTLLSKEPTQDPKQYQEVIQGLDKASQVLSHVAITLGSILYSDASCAVDNPADKSNVSMKDDCLTSEKYDKCLHQTEQCEAEQISVLNSTVGIQKEKEQKELFVKQNDLKSQSQDETDKNHEESQIQEPYEQQQDQAKPENLTQEQCGDHGFVTQKTLDTENHTQKQCGDNGLVTQKNYSQEHSVNQEQETLDHNKEKKDDLSLVQQNPKKEYNDKLEESHHENQRKKDDSQRKDLDKEKISVPDEIQKIEQQGNLGQLQKLYEHEHGNQKQTKQNDVSEEKYGGEELEQQNKPSNEFQKDKQEKDHANYKCDSLEIANQQEDNKQVEQTIKNVERNLQQEKHFSQNQPTLEKDGFMSSSNIDNNTLQEKTVPALPSSMCHKLTLPMKRNVKRSTYSSRNLQELMKEVEQSANKFVKCDVDRTEINNSTEMKHLETSTESPNTSSQISAQIEVPTKENVADKVDLKVTENIAEIKNELDGDGLKAKEKLKAQDLPTEDGSQEICPVQPKIDSIFPAIICSMTHPWSFHVQISNFINVIAKLIQQAVETGLAESIIPQNDIYCLAKFNEQNYHRAKILSIQDQHGQDSSVKVLFIDYGIRKSVSTKDIYSIPEALTKHPSQAMFCALQGVSPKNNQYLWTEEAILEFQQLTKDKQIQVKVLYKSPFDRTLTAFPHLVDIMFAQPSVSENKLRNEVNCTSMATHLIKNGFSRFMKERDQIAIFSKMYSNAEDNIKEKVKNEEVSSTISPLFTEVSSKVTPPVTKVLYQYLPKATDQNVITKTNPFTNFDDTPALSCSNFPSVQIDASRELADEIAKYELSNLVNEKLYQIGKIMSSQLTLKNHETLTEQGSQKIDISEDNIINLSPNKELLLSNTESEVEILVMVSSVISPTSFFVHQVSKNFVQKLNKLVQELLSFSKTLSNLSNLSANFTPTVNSLVCTKCLKDGYFYRGLVLAIEHSEKDCKHSADGEANSEKLLIFFMDYGNFDWVSCSQVLPLPDKFKQIKPLVLWCSLKYIKPCNAVINEDSNEPFVWSADVVKEFQSMVCEEKVFSAVMSHASLKQVNDLTSFQFEPVPVFFLDKNVAEEEVCINYDLILMKMATLDPVTNKSDIKEVASFDIVGDNANNFTKAECVTSESQDTDCTKEQIKYCEAKQRSTSNSLKLLRNKQINLQLTHPTVGPQKEQEHKDKYIKEEQTKKQNYEQFEEKHESSEQLKQAMNEKYQEEHQQICRMMNFKSECKFNSNFEQEIQEGHEQAGYERYEHDTEESDRQDHYDDYEQECQDDTCHDAYSNEFLNNKETEHLCPVQDNNNGKIHNEKIWQDASMKKCPDLIKKNESRYKERLQQCQNGTQTSEFQNEQEMHHMNQKCKHLEAINHQEKSMQQTLVMKDASSFSPHKKLAYQDSLPIEKPSKEFSCSNSFYKNTQFEDVPPTSSLTKGFKQTLPMKRIIKRSSGTARSLQELMKEVEKKANNKPVKSDIDRTMSINTTDKKSQISSKMEKLEPIFVASSNDSKAVEKIGIKNVSEKGCVLSSKLGAFEENHFNICPVQPEKDSIFPAVISSSTHPWSFHVQTIGYINILAGLIKHAIETGTAETIVPQCGIYCLAKLCEQNYHRAKILSVQEQPGQGPNVKVLFIDYGMKKFVFPTDIYSIPFALTKYPSQAMFCALQKASPKNSKCLWTEESILEFQQLTKNKQIQVKVVYVSPNDSKAQTAFPHLVDIIFAPPQVSESQQKNKNTTKSMAAHLIEKSFAGVMQEKEQIAALDKMYSSTEENVLEKVTKTEASIPTAKTPTFVDISSKVTNILHQFSPKFKEQYDAAIFKPIASCSSESNSSFSNTISEETDARTTAQNKADHELKIIVNEKLFHLEKSFKSSNLTLKYHDIFDVFDQETQSKLIAEESITSLPLNKGSSPSNGDTEVEILVMVSAVISPTSFFVHQVSKSFVQKLNKLVQDLLSMSITTLSNLSNLSANFTPSVHSLVCIQCPRDGYFYRGLVLAVDHNDNPYRYSPVSEASSEKGQQLLVFYIDYGNFDWVSRCKVFPLPQRLKHLKPLALWCSLKYVKPYDATASKGGIEPFVWSATVVKEFQSMVCEEKVFSAVMSQTSLKQVNDSTSFQFEPLQVFLLDRNATGEEICINYDLILNTMASLNLSTRKSDYPSVENTRQNNSFDKWDPMNDDYTSIRNSYKVDTDDAGVAVVGYTSGNTNKEGEKICVYYNRPSGCYRSDHCPNLHVKVDFSDIWNEKVPVKVFDEDQSDLLPEQGSTVAVTVSHIVTPNQFYVNLSWGHLNLENLEDGPLREKYLREETLEKMMTNMQEYYRSSTQFDGDLILLAPGQAMAAQILGQWVRVKVIDTDVECGLVQVMSVDFGYQSWVNEKDLRELGLQFLHLTPQAVECSLVDLKPKDQNNGWTQETCERFVLMVEQKSLVAWVKERHPTGLLSVVLYDSRNAKKISLNQKLVDAGLALLVPHSDTAIRRSNDNTKRANCNVIKNLMPA